MRAEPNPDPTDPPSVWVIVLAVGVATTLLVVAYRLVMDVWPFLYF